MTPCENSQAPLYTSLMDLQCQASQLHVSKCRAYACARRCLESIPHNGLSIEWDEKNPSLENVANYTNQLIQTVVEGLKGIADKQPNPVEDSLRKNNRAFNAATLSLSLFQQNLNNLREIKKDHDRCSAFYANSCAVANAGIFDTAIELANEIGDKTIQAMALAYIATKMAEAGNLDDSIVLANTIADPKQQQVAKKGIAIAYAKSSQIDEAEKLTKTLENPILKAETLKEIAIEAAKAQQHDYAKSLASTISVKTEKNNAFIALVKEKAKDDIDGANALLQNLDSQTLRDRALSHIYLEMVKLGQEEKAIEGARAIESETKRSITLKNISLEQAKQKRSPEALLLAKQIPCPKQKALALIDIYLETRQIALVCETADNVDAEFKDHVLEYSSIELAKRGHLGEAQVLASKIDTLKKQSHALKVISIELAQSQLFSQAVDSAKTVKDPSERAIAFYSIYRIAHSSLLR